MIKEIPERMMRINAETPEENQMESVVSYMYPLMKASAKAEAREEIREMIYNCGLSSWDLIKVLRAIDGFPEED